MLGEDHRKTADNRIALKVKTFTLRMDALCMTVLRPVLFESGIFSSPLPMSETLLKFGKKIINVGLIFDNKNFNAVSICLYKNVLYLTVQFSFGFEYIAYFSGLHQK